MAVALQPSQLLADHLHLESHAGITVFKLTQEAQTHFDDLLTRRKEVPLSHEEQAELEALTELDRIFTYVNAQLLLAQQQAASSP